MRKFINLRWWLLLFLPVPLAYWALQTFLGFTPSDSLSFFGIATLIHGLILLPITRQQPRRLSTILVPTVFATCAAFLLESFDDSPLRLSVYLLAIGYPASLLLRNCPSLAHLREMGLISWRGLIILFAIIAAVMTGVLDEFGIASSITLWTVFIIPLVVTWRLADTWWSQLHLRLSLLAAAITGFWLFILLGGTLVDPNPIIDAIATTLVMLTLVLWSLLLTTGLRFAWHYRPSLPVLRAAGLVDWRGLIFVSGLIFGAFLSLNSWIDWKFLPTGVLNLFIFLILLD